MKKELLKLVYLGNLMVMGSEYPERDWSETLQEEIFQTYAKQSGKSVETLKNEMYDQTIKYVQLYDKTKALKSAEKMLTNQTDAKERTEREKWEKFLAEFAKPNELCVRSHSEK